VGITSKAVEFYASGLSLVQIAQRLNRSKSRIRKSLKEAGVVLRPSYQSSELVRNTPQLNRIGVPPFGYRILRGRLILDAREIEIVHLVMSLWKTGQNFSAIARALNGRNIKNRKATPWDHSLVRSIVERHKDKSSNLDEE
jgi:DNA-binding CsgD family transcriptional regulator